MGANISGIVIDQTRTEGKWYVRELKNENGGVTPMFFRREKSDLLGRLVDKFRHVESAQRYAARHMSDLGFQHHEEIGSVYATSGKLRPTADERDKLLSERLQQLLNDKVAQSGINPLVSTAPTTHGADVESSCPVTVILNKSDLNQELHVLWDSFKRHFSLQSKNDKKAFYEEMGNAIRLSRGELRTSDPKVWETSKELIKYISLRDDGDALQGTSRKTWQTLCDFFAPATPASEPSPQAAVDHAFHIAGKASFVLEDICEARSANASMSPKEFKQALQQIFRIYLEETATAEAAEAVSDLLPPIAVTLDGTALSRLLILAREVLDDSSLTLPAGDSDLLSKAADAVSHRLRLLHEA